MSRANTKLELTCFSQRLTGGKSGNSHCTTFTVMYSHHQPLLSHNLLPQFCSCNCFQAKFTLVFRNNLSFYLVVEPGKSQRRTSIKNPVDRNVARGSLSHHHPPPPLLSPQTHNMKTFSLSFI